MYCNSAITTPHPSGLIHGQITEGGIAPILLMDHGGKPVLTTRSFTIRNTMIEGELIFIKYRLIRIKMKSQNMYWLETVVCSARKGVDVA